MSLNLGSSPEQATAICNQVNLKELREQTQSPTEKEEAAVTLSRSTFLRALDHLAILKHEPVQRRKTGNKSANLKWAKARVVRAKMTLEMLDNGRKLESGELTMADLISKDLLPLYGDGIIYSDEMHTKAVPSGGNGQDGSMRGRQYRVSVDPKTGIPSQKGVLPDRKSQIHPKYLKQASGCFSVAKKTTADGTVEAKFLPTLFYTEQRMLSGKESRVSQRDQDRTQRDKTKGVWAPYDSYYSRFMKEGEENDRAILAESQDWKEIQEVMSHEWYRKREKALGNKVSIKEMLLHLFQVGEEYYNGTNRENTWMIWHDILSILWEHETQEWLKRLKCPIEGWEDRSWYDRIIRLRGQYNGEVSTYYKDALPGDSPEMMPLDCHLFSDLKEGVSRNVALTFYMPDSDPRKYSIATPKRAENAITRTMATHPSAARILADINRIPTTMQRIIDAEGCYIMDSSGQSGVRAGLNVVNKTEQRMASYEDDILVAFHERVAAMMAGKGLPYTFEAPEEEAEVEVDMSELLQVDNEDEDEPESGDELPDSDE